MLLLEKWRAVLLLNKYDVGLTDVDYKICLNDHTPIKSYIPRYSQGVREAILKELDKMKEANFIEPSILLLQHLWCVFEKVTVVFVSQLIFK